MGISKKQISENTKENSTNYNIKQIQFTHRTTFKKLNTLKVEDLLKLQELKFYYKYRHQNLPVYFLNWQITPNTHIHNYNTRRTTELHTYRTKHEFAKKILKYNLPHVINNIPDLVIDKIVTHSLKSFSSYAKNYMLQKYNDTCTLLNCYICQLN